MKRIVRSIRWLLLAAPLLVAPLIPGCSLFPN